MLAIVRQVFHYFDVYNVNKDNEDDGREEVDHGNHGNHGNPGNHGPPQSSFTGMHSSVSYIDPREFLCAVRVLSHPGLKAGEAHVR
jgi:hypothetical protein